AEGSTSSAWMTIRAFVVILHPCEQMRLGVLRLRWRSLRCRDVGRHGTLPRWAAPEFRLGLRGPGRTSLSRCLRMSAEPAVAADRPGITVFRGLSPLPPALLLNYVVRYHVGGEVSEVVQVSVR